MQPRRRRSLLHELHLRHRGLAGDRDRPRHQRLDHHELLLQGRIHTQPHTLLATTTGSCTGATAQYTYGASGNTTKRPDGSTAQDLQWDREGKLSRLTKDPTGAARATDYVYVADGALRIRRNAAANGETVLYLGATEVHLQAGKKWANRYYTHAGSTVALRSNQSGTEKTTYLAGDQHNTDTVAIIADTQSLTKRYLPPRSAPTGAAARRLGPTTRHSSARPPTPTPASPTSAHTNTTRPSASSSASTRFSRSISRSPSTPTPTAHRTP